MLTLLRLLYKSKTSNKNYWKIGGPWA